MNRKTKNILKMIWIMVVTLFAVLQFYNVIQGNYFDIITTVLIFLIAILMFCLMYVINKND